MRFTIITGIVVAFGMLLVGCSGLNGDASHQAGRHVELIPTRTLTLTTTISEQTVVLEDLGMLCPLCRAAVASKLGRVPGVITVEVDLHTDSATVQYDPSQVTIEKLTQAVAEAGYQVRGVREVASD